MRWTLVLTLPILSGYATLAMAQGPPLPRRAVAVAVDSLAGQGGTFADVSRVGGYDRSLAPFHLIGKQFDAATVQTRDSILIALADCFTDSTATMVRIRDQPAVRGALCYMMLHSLVYREAGDHWPGYIDGAPTMPRLRAAQRAWRTAVRRHWYITL
jgi:hypothetical protein